ncbi:uncharacterized protein LOC142340003 isoform X2 [Convolutriloba macropyga]|uniref:uncharacterized protein LOC142340003 isoform X2 n=1 Tax=Convolutriloba macropyga TaxID=536237 RepID=UPI003F52117F
MVGNRTRWISIIILTTTVMLLFTLQSILLPNFDYYSFHSILPREFEYNLTTQPSYIANFATQGSPEKISLLMLHYSHLPLRSDGDLPAVNLKDKCGLTFDCQLYNDLDKNLPIRFAANYSALVAYGPGHARIATLYKEVGGLAARPREQFWVSTAGESAINRNNGNHIQGLRHLFNWTASMGRGLTFQLKFIRIEKRKSPKSIQEIEQEVKQHFDKKSNLTCWAMSNCRFTYTGRVTLAKNLVKHLPEKLQLFGKGGKNLYGWL